MTKDERTFQDAVRRLGCCVCVRTGLGATPCDIHHILSPGKRRAGESQVIGLCPTHHRAGLHGREVSRHPYKAQFEAKYGSEQELLDWTQRAVERLLHHVP